MTFDQAMALLGLDPSERDPSVVRAAYLTAIRAHHPDLHPEPGFVGASALIIDAHRVVRNALDSGDTDTATDTAGSAAPTRPGTPPPAAGPEPDRPAVRVVADDTIEIDAPADMAYAALVQTAHRVGDVTFLDRSAAVLQIVVTFDGEPACQILFDLQGRAARGTTEIFCTIESMEDRPAPPIEAVTRFVASELAKG